MKSSIFSPAGFKYFVDLFKLAYPGRARQRLISQMKDPVWIRNELRRLFNDADVIIDMVASTRDGHHFLIRSQIERAVEEMAQYLEQHFLKRTS